MVKDRYQTGSLERRKSALGMCWFLRFRERKPDGTIERPRIRIGLISEYPTKAAARRAADRIRQEFNSHAGLPKPQALFGELLEKYEREGMPERYSTAQSYKSMIRVHIRPKWAGCYVVDVRPQDVRPWLLGMPLAPKTRGHIKGLMSVLFRYAMFLGYLPTTENPMTTFSIPSHRKEEPRILTQAEFKLLMTKLTAEPFRTMVIVAACLGLSCSELIGIRWEDVDWIGKQDGPVVHVRTGVVNGRVDGVKNKFRKKPLPLSPDLLKVLQSHFQRVTKEARQPDDFLFASPYTSFESPYNPGEVLKKYIRPAATAAGLGEGIGWHTFRHSYRAWLGEKGAELEIQKDLMRHSNISTTMDVYGGTFPKGLREANEKVVEGLLQ